MYLTKLEMSLNNRETVYCLQNYQRMHALLAEMFNSQRRDNNLLYRSNLMNNKIVIYIYSDNQVCRKPDNVLICGQKNISRWVDSLKTGMIFSFDVITAPTKKVADEAGGNSKRRMLRSREERFEWFERKAAQNGFLIQQLNELEQYHNKVLHKDTKGGEMFVDSIHYQGILQVTDEGLFQNVIKTGIGSGKAYGLGMMMLKQV